MTSTEKHAFSPTESENAVGFLRSSTYLFRAYVNVAVHQVVAYAHAAVFVGQRQIQVHPFIVYVLIIVKELPILAKHYNQVVVQCPSLMVRSCLLQQTRHNIPFVLLISFLMLIQHFIKANIRYDVAANEHEVVAE